MNGGPPFYTSRGAQPRPVSSSVAGRSSWRGSMILVAVMFGWMILVFILAAAVAPLDANIEVPVDIGKGVIVTPADGWYSAEKVWDVGSGGLSLQKSGVYVAFVVEDYSGSNDELLSEQLAALEEDFQSLRILPAGPILVARDVPGLVALFSGTSKYWGSENELVVATTGGMGVVMLATASKGQLDQVQGDIKTMLDTLVVPR